MPVHVPSFAAKLRLLYAYTGLTRQRLALRIGRAESTLSGWLNGTATSRPEMAPDDRLEVLAAVLVEALKQRISVEEARRYWLGAFDPFAALFSQDPSRATRFALLLERAPRQSLLTYVPSDASQSRAVRWFAPNDSQAPAQGEAAPISARVGDEFCFNAQGPAHCQLVVIVESAIGRHLGVPAPGVAGKFGAEGRLRLPARPHTYGFEEPRGLHRFLAFAVDAKKPLSIAACAGQISPLADHDLEQLALELDDGGLVSSWSLDIVRVIVGEA